MTTLIISDEEMIDIMKIVKSLEESGKTLAKQLKLKQKKKKRQISQYVIRYIRC